MSGLPRALVLPLLALGCASDTGEEAAALMRHALESTRASQTLVGQAPRGTPAANTAAAVAPGMMPAPNLAPGASRSRGSGPPGTAAALVGVTADQVRRMLGDASIRRPEGAAEVWLYEAPACRLDVILYAEGPSLVVAHAAARALGGAEGVTEAACLSAVAAAPASAPWAAPGPRL